MRTPNLGGSGFFTDEGEDVLRNLTETFDYDPLNRLTTISKNGIIVKNMAYVANGNITSQTGVGTYSYDASKIHQVNKIDNITAFPASNQDITYTVFNKVNDIKEGNVIYSFKYGPDQERVKMTYTNSINATLNYVRYYATGYEKEIKGNFTKETNYISGANGTVAMYVVTNGVVKMYYLVQDHLGSIAQILNEDVTLAAEQSFDTWGRLRNATDWSYAGFTVSTITARGYTGHEHLDDVNIINMNGRLYDPITCRFLSPDPYIQSPDNTQNYNRYSYCVNNPMRYTDPTGKFFIFTGLVDLVHTAFFKGGLDPTSGKARDNAWKSFDPTASWSKTNKAIKIDGGLFNTDPNKGFWGRTWELISRFTWQAPQTTIGYLNAHQYNIRGEVNSVDYFGGATVVNTKGRWGGVTLGNYIVGDETIRAEVGNDLFMHEYGHYIQSQVNGPTYLFKYGLPSLISANGNGNHGEFWTEGDANERSYQYFNKHYGVTEAQWDRTGNVRGNIRNTEWWEYGVYFGGMPYMIPFFNLK